MSYYRLYFMSAFTGHIDRFEDFDAADDGEAVALATSRQGLFALELWCSRRKVARIDPLDLGSQLLAGRGAQKAVKTQVGPQASSQIKQGTNRSA